MRARHDMVVVHKEASTDRATWFSILVGSLPEPNEPRRSYEGVWLDFHVIFTCIWPSASALAKTNQFAGQAQSELELDFVRTAVGECFAKPDCERAHLSVYRGAEGSLCALREIIGVGCTRPPGITFLDLRIYCGAGVVIELDLYQPLHQDPFVSQVRNWLDSASATYPQGREPT